MRYITSDSMTNTVLFDYNRKHLLPFTFTRPVADLRAGILTLRQHWELLLEQPTSFFTEEYLSKKFPVWREQENLFLNGALIPSQELLDAARNLMLGQRLVWNNIPLAAFAEGWPDPASPYGRFTDIEFKGTPTVIRHTWDLFTHNEKLIRAQFELLKAGKKSHGLSTTNKIIAPENIFVEEGVKAEHAIINASAGPVFLGKGSEIMEGAMIRGPFALGEQAVVKMGAKIYGATTVGPFSKVGGEINNSILFSYSNKAHDGFLGNSVIGEWCNLGADTNNSNLKNNYSDVRVYNYASRSMENSGLKFCGLFMGDHSKCGINTMFNTGTVTGVSANIFGSGFPPKFIPSFSWGGYKDSPRFVFEKAADLARQVFSRRGLEFDATEEALFKSLFELTTDDNPSN
jgi:UDP-N-acetylglucosamine diphosphorylase/glucosamine-1-phosphate N-acetyltransferase